MYAGIHKLTKSIKIDSCLRRNNKEAKTMKRVLFIDRDGTIIKEPADEQIDSFEKLEFYPKALSCLLYTSPSPRD